ncbi:MAG: glucose-1-phosphate adenylyltransferase subunit GlgD [Clostridiales bacterium]|nr:glucose-1-phosphate adenylyltransferase subunit GlgD [Clostridiales bacterium]
MINGLGLIFSNIHEDQLREITNNRTMASVPFGGRYRIVDFVLSNMTNAGINTVGIITKTNYQSLMDHVGSGKEWNLARKNGGLHFLPPYGRTTGNFVYKGKVQALKGVFEFLSKTKERYVVLSDCDIVAGIDLDEVFDFHIKKRADITMMYTVKQITKEEASKSTLLNVDFDERVFKMINRGSDEGYQKVSMNVWIMEKSFLMALIDEASVQGARHIEEEVLAPRLRQLKIYGFRFNGYSAKIDSLANYYARNMDLLDRDVRKKLFEGKRIYTKIKDEVPTYYDRQCKVSNSLVGDGCIIEGTVKDSILFRGVKVEKGAVVENSILMQDSSIGEYAHLHAVILDKNVVIKNNRNLSGHETYPLYVSKGGVI